MAEIITFPRYIVVMDANGQTVSGFQRERRAVIEEYPTIPVQVSFEDITEEQFRAVFAASDAGLTDKFQALSLQLASERDAWAAERDQLRASLAAAQARIAELTPPETVQ